MAKMTEEQIIKALKCCSKPYCNDNKCPLHRNTINTKDCITQMSVNALDLINRQKANAEGLINAVKFLNEKLSYAKAEAVKEFADRLKEELNNVAKIKIDDYDYFCVGLGFIDNLVKEMVGDTE